MSTTADVMVHSLEGLWNVLSDPKDCNVESLWYQRLKFRIQVACIQKSSFFFIILLTGDTEKHNNERKKVIIKKENTSIVNSFSFTHSDVYIQCLQFLLWSKYCCRLHCYIKRAPVNTFHLTEDTVMLVVQLCHIKVFPNQFLMLREMLICWKSWLRII